MKARGLVAIGAAALVLAALRPWTIRPIAPSSPVFDAGAYATARWSEVLAEADARARDIRDVVSTTPTAAPDGAPRRYALFVKGRGRLAPADRASRAGTARVEIAGATGTTVRIQIGPVIRGTAVRDALSFVRFSDFANQTEFAAVAGALNDRAMADLLGATPVDALAGATVDVVGAVVIDEAARDVPLDIVPLRVVKVGSAQ